MELLNEIFILPFQMMVEDPVGFFQVVLEGSMSGVLYSLVALGFALIYKASGVFNFAQGMFVVFAALGLIAFNAMGQSGLIAWSLITLIIITVLMIEKLSMPIGKIAAIFFIGLCLIGVFAFIAPIILAIFLTIAMMILVAAATERVVLRPLVNNEQIILFMATIGLFFFMEGLGETIFGGNVRTIPTAALGMEQGAVEFFGIRLLKIDLTAAVVAGIMVVLLAVLFQKTSIGRALRAVADDHQAAMSVGIPLNAMWVIVWSVAGVVALVAGVMWGASSGSVSFSLVNIALKALPVLILGGFTSIPGVIVGGFIIGIGEKLFEIYWDDVFPGTTEDWFAYVLALIVLLFRPQGLFGEKIIERV